MTIRHDFNDCIGTDSLGNAHTGFRAVFPDWENKPTRKWGQYCEMVMKGTVGGLPAVDEEGNKRIIGDDFFLERDEEGRPLLGDLDNMEKWRSQKVERVGRMYMNECYSKS